MKKLLIIVSTFLVLLSIYLPLKPSDSYIKELGYSIAYIDYISIEEVPDNRVKVFSPSNWLNISFNPIEFALNSTMVYFFLFYSIQTYLFIYSKLIR